MRNQKVPLYHYIDMKASCGAVADIDFSWGREYNFFTYIGKTFERVWCRTIGPDKSIATGNFFVIMHYLMYG